MESTRDPTPPPEASIAAAVELVRLTTVHAELSCGGILHGKLCLTEGPGPPASDRVPSAGGRLPVAPDPQPPTANRQPLRIHVQPTSSYWELSQGVR